MRDRLPTRVRRSVAGHTAAAALAGYLLVSFLYFGLPVAAHPGRSFIGNGFDAEIFIWMFGWWPHALGEGLDPLTTRVLWVPEGLDLAWTTNVPGLALAVAPVTLLAGPVVAYNLASVLLPALAAWTAFLLCRYVTGSVWASLAGGYLFGFSGYMLGHESGHLHLTSVCLVPLIALVLLRYLDGELGGRGLALRLGVLLALQFSFSTEVYFTLTVALAVALVVAVVVAPRRRARLRRSLLPLAGGYLLSAVLVSPLLYAMLRHFETESINSPQDYPGDLLNPVLPTKLTLLGGDWAASISGRFAGNLAENGAYLGLPTLLIVGLFAWRRRREDGARFLFVTFVLALLAALGTALHVAGHRVVALPWSVLARAPVFDNVLPVRLVLFASLAASVMVACWAATAPRRGPAIALTALAVLTLVPNLGAGLWKRTPVRPAFFADGPYRACIARGENVLAIPYNQYGDSLLWQVESGFRFGLAEGYVRPHFPDPYASEQIVPLINGYRPTGEREATYGWAQSRGVTTILVQQSGDDDGWAAFLTGPGRRAYRVGGVALFPVVPGQAMSAECRRAGAAG